MNREPYHVNRMENVVTCALWVTCAYGCYVQDKLGGLSGSLSQDKSLQYIRRQLSL